MGCCCTKILELCRVSVCGTDAIRTGANVPITGTYKLVLDYLDNSVVIEAALIGGDPMDFSSTNLNEKYKYTGKILGPTGTLVTITIGEEVYDCLSFQTGMEYSLNILNP